MNKNCVVFSIMFIISGFMISCHKLKVYDQENQPIFMDNDISNIKAFNSEALKIASYNIAFGQEVETAIEILTGYPELSDIDVLFLQEIDEIGTKKIANALKLNYLYFPISFEKEYQQNFGNAILCRTKLLDPRKIILPNRKSTTNRLRSATLASSIINDQKLVLCSAHIATISVGIKKQAEQIEYLIQELSKITASRVIIGGDFNTIVPDLELNLKQQFFEIAYSEMSDRIRHTATTPISFLKPSLDHIYAKGFSSNQQGKVADNGASDHFPIWVELQLD